MGQSITFLATRQNVTPASLAAWQSVDISAFVPVGCTMALFHIIGGNQTTAPLGLRKPGSTDSFTDQIRTSDTADNLHFWAWCGVSGQAFECYLDDNTKYTLWLVGYGAAGINMFTNGTRRIADGDANPATWIDTLDLSAELTAGAAGAFWEIVQSGGGGKYYGVRKPGGTGSRVGRVEFHGWAVSGVDASRLVGVNCSAQADYPTVHNVIGEITDGVVFLDTPVNKTPAIDAAYHNVDCSAEAPAAIGLIFNVADGGGERYWNIRKPGDANDDYWLMNRHAFCIVECSAAQIVEAKVQVGTAATFMWLVGYLTPPDAAQPSFPSVAAQMVAAGVM